jgi:hypothetical protein
MTFILRVLAILALLALMLVSLAPALASTVVLAGLPVDFGAALSPEAAVQLRADAGASTWLEVGLWYAAGLFFLVAAIRLLRRTQGFWLWLLGFACFGARWAVPQQGDPLATFKTLDVNAYVKPEALVAAPTSPETQLAFLAIVLIIGLAILIVDAADRAHWNKQEE